MGLAIAIMAAGKGTRMKSDLAKVLHPVCNRPMVEYVIETSQALQPDTIVLIVGHQAERVKEATEKFGVKFALQEPQLGTGHAVMQIEPVLKDFSGDIIILSGDVPLISRETLEKMLTLHRDRGAVATVLTTALEDPTGYGRVIRDASGQNVLKIVEHKDATEAEREINEINSGIYVFEKTALFNALHRIDNNNAQKEYYLPDVFKIYFSEGKKIVALLSENFSEIRGVNTVDQLAEVESALLER